MSAPAAMFFLMLISQGGGSFSMSAIGSYESRAACTTALQGAAKTAGLIKGTQFACVSEESLGVLQAANR